ncbi:MAG: 30S ribosomal protein S4 [Chitinophagales bacterium]|jgi:small subunit ribosomal protein S4|nr:30S ribosomal protein S4 [Chitinophagaceae bacterium]MBP9882356.1 30S ribosomal protein S4 [Chitinophagales bacterium]
MARFTGSKAKINRRFGEPIMGYTKSLEKKSYPPGMHGQSRKKKQPSEYATQLKEKQKAKMTYGLLERQFARFYSEAVRKKGVTGENLLKLLEARLDNTVFRLGVAPTRRAARQLVAHKHITVNGRVAGIPSLVLRAGDVISIKEKSKGLAAITQALGNRESKYPWLEWNSDTLKGIFLAMPEKDQIPENIHEQLIVELYSK